MLVNQNVTHKVSMLCVIIYFTLTGTIIYKMDIVLYTEGDLKLGIESDLRFVRIDFTFQMETLHLVIITSLVKPFPEVIAPTLLEV